VAIRSAACEYTKAGAGASLAGGVDAAHAPSGDRIADDLLLAAAVAVTQTGAAS